MRSYMSRVGENTIRTAANGWSTAAKAVFVWFFGKVSGVPGDHVAGKSGSDASPWVVRFLGGVKSGGRILDVASGGGRHLRLALEAGYRVAGVDRDVSGLSDLAGLDEVWVVESDLEAGCATPLQDRFGPGSFDGVIVTNYLWRPILADIVSMMGDDGILIYETFALGNERVGRGKPSNPDFLLRPGELLDVIRPHLTAIAYEHALLEGPERVVQRVVAVGPKHRWLLEPPAGWSGLR